MIICQTPRLSIEQLQLSDAPFILELLNTPGWIQYIGDRNVHSIAAAEQYLLKGPLKSYQDHGFGLYKVQLVNTNTPIGMCGILQRNTLPNPDMGFAFLPQYTGQGYALEAAQAVLDFSVEKLNIHTVMGITLPSNRASIMLLEKLGMRYQNPVHLPNDPEELSLYSTRY